MENTNVEKPVRLAVFSTTRQAREAVTGLLIAGFTKEQITVMCSDLAKKQHFSEYEHRQPAGTKAAMAAAAGGAIDSGGLVGAMMTRGVEKEAAIYYDQAVTRGEILVAAEDQSDHAEQLLARAERVFAAAGAARQPVRQFVDPTS